MLFYPLMCVYFVIRYMVNLRQAPRAWYNALSSALLSFGLIRSRSDSSLSTLCRGSTHLYILAYVDDLIITGSCDNLVAALISQLQ